MACSRMRKHLAIVQVSNTQAAVLRFSSNNEAQAQQQFLSVQSPIKGLDVFASRALIWTSTSAHLFELCSDGGWRDAHLMLQVQNNSLLALHKDYIFQALECSVTAFCKESVATKHLLLLDEPQGTVLAVDTCEDFLYSLTSRGYIRRWKVDGLDITPCGPTSKCKGIAGESEICFGSLRSNCDGSKLSFLAKPGSGSVILCIYDVLLDKFDFSSLTPTVHSWDCNNPLVLVCQAETLLVTFFATSDYGLVEENKALRDCSTDGLLGICLPFIYFYQNAGEHSHFHKEAMQLFEGLETLVDEKMQAMLLQFNLNLVLGNMDDAYKTIESIQDSFIWEQLARFCVKSNMLDPARYCVAKVQNGIGGTMGANFSSCSTAMTNDTHLAKLAIELGLTTEAESVYNHYKRYDHLNLLFQMCSDWEESLSIASKRDSVHLKTTHHAYAKHLEGLGHIKEATKHYELSDTYRYEIPRMLVSLNFMEELEAYVKKSKDPSMQQWWAHYCEANDDLPKAIDYYTSAGDIASVVRVYCYLNEFNAAAQTAMSSMDNSAIFQLARQHEKNGNYHEAMILFTKAGKSGYAAKLAMKHGIDGDLLSLSLQSSKDIMVLSARYFEEKGMHEEAVLLYQKGGNFERAIDVCVQSELFDALKAIAKDLDEGTDPSLLSRCGDFLLSRNQTEQAVFLYISAKQHDRALDLCIKESVLITDSLADHFTTMVPDNDSEYYKQLIVQLGKCCEAQSSYHLACKKYTQAGDRVKGMKALIRARDTERVVLFANTSREKQLYVVAAKYLQTLEWHDDPILMKTIVQMYIKAGEVELLAGFYLACAQIEIDEFRDYEKALGAMKEALKYAGKSNESFSSGKLATLQARIAEVERFVQIRRMAKSDPAGMVLACSELLPQLPSQEDTDTEVSIHVGDVFALLVEYFFSQGNMEQAFSTLEKMKSRQISLDLYIDQHIIDAIYQVIKQDDA